MALRTIYLHGSLGEKYGDSFRFDVATAGEAIRALSTNFKGFPDDLKEGSWEIVRGDPSDGLNLELDDINSFKLGAGDLHIIPVVAGSKRSGTIKTIIGVALVGTALVASGGALGAAVAPVGLLSGITYGNIAMVGLALAVAGVAQMLAPKEHPKTNNTGNSFSLTPSNVYEQGGPVPLVYGEVICGSVVISSGMDVESIPVNWSPVSLGATDLGSIQVGAQNILVPVVY